MEKVQYAGVELANVKKICDLDYEDGFMCLLGSSERVQLTSDKLTKTSLGMCFTASKCKVLL